MRTILLLSTLLVSVAAQAYEPLIREDRVWEYYKCDCAFLHSVTSLTTYQFEGTQQINGKTYHQLMKKAISSWEYDGTGDFYNVVDSQPVNTVEALLREEDGKVYMLVQTPSIAVYDGSNGLAFTAQEVPESGEIVLYDFTQSQTESSFYASGNFMHRRYQFEYDCPPVTKYEVVEVSNDNLGGKEFTLRNCAVSELSNADDLADRFGADFAEVRVLEGIGNIGAGSFLIPETKAELEVNGEGSSDSGFNNLYDLSGNVIREGEKIKSPTASVSDLMEDSDKSEKMYDVYGRVINNPTPGTIYIRDGKKQIAR